MKKIIVIFLVLVAGFVYAQEKPPSDSSSDVIVETADKLPEFPGGIDEFRKEFMKAFRSDKIEGKGLVKTEIKIVINKDGTIANIMAVGINKSFNNESIRTIKTIKERWVPAEINGEKVRYRYRLPLTMNFE